MESVGEKADLSTGEQPSPAMDSSTQTHPPSPQTLSGHSPRSIKSESHANTKRDFESAFPDLSPDRTIKRSRSHSDSLSYPSASANTVDYNDTTLDGTVNYDDTVADDNVATTTGNKSCEMAQASPQSPLRSALHLACLQGAPVTETNTVESDGTADLDHNERTCKHSLGEIRRHLEIIKQSFHDGNIDLNTAKTLIDDINSLVASNFLTMHAEIARMTRIVLQPDGVLASPTTHESDETAPQQAASSPLSSPISLLSFPGSASAISSPVISTEFKNKASQTEPDIIPHASAAVDDDHHSFSDNQLWERELELIRRPQPLKTGACITVNVPLREVISHLAPAAQSVKTSTFNSINHSTSQVYKDDDVISVSDASEGGGEGGPTRASQLVGGGSIIYGMNGAEFISSDEGEREETETFIGNQDPEHRYQFNKYEGTGDDLPDYEDYEINEDTNGEATGYNQYNSRFMTPNRPSYNDNHVHSNYSYHNNEIEDSRFVEDFVIEPSRSRDRGRINDSRKHTTVDRERSRSPGYQRTRSVEETPYRESRYRSYYRYGREGEMDGPSDESFSSTYVNHESSHGAKHDIQEKYERGRTPWRRHMNTYKHRNRRYMREEPEDPSFYGYGPSSLTAQVQKTLRYQDRFTEVGEVPGPKSSLRLKLDDYVRDTGINQEIGGLERRIKHVIDETFYSGETLDEEQAWQRSWAKDTTKLYKGFPLVENIEFVAADNNAKPDGDCYWRALAYSLHGNPIRWDIIKAEHLTYLQHVLSDKTHPRHELYAKLNSQFFESHGPATSKFKANLWQLLHMPHAWTPGVMQQITADLYNIHLVTFTYKSHQNMCSEVSVRGAYNSRHVFMLFIDGNHFQPLTVNQYLS
ncbi:hypothetical protein F4825DRAFT_453596 [Nemania diffusa]|nr:hypothetical protein F4825DRAFT_453596 [Nemania diffusa]